MNLKNKVITFLSILSLSLSLPTIPVNAAAKAGAKCNKVGITSVASGKTFTCVKTGKKLVWDKGVTVSIPSTTLTPTSFQDLLERYEGIPLKVWNESQKLVTSGRVSTKFEINIGPNTKFPLDNRALQSQLESISKLWSQQSQPNTTKVFLFSFLDLAWAQQKNRDLNGSWFTPEDLAMNCSSSSSCGAYGGTYMGTGQLFVGVPTNSYNKGRSNLGHEYTHAVQYDQFKSQPTVNGYSLLPCWFSEGQPQVPGSALGFDSVEEYKQSRLMWFRNPAGALGDYSPESILKFYSLAGISKLGNCDPKVRSRIYDVGYMTVEALAAIKGVNATMDVVVGVSQGLSFEDSFKKVYEISWSEAAPILAKVVSAEFTR